MLRKGNLWSRIVTIVVGCVALLDDLEERLRVRPVGGC